MRSVNSQRDERRSRPGVAGFLAVAASLLLLSSAAASTLAPVGGGFDRGRYAVIAIDADSGIILHQANMNEPRHPASLAKMMTLYLLFESLEADVTRLYDKFTVSERASKREPSKLGLRPGSKIEVEQAILALVTKSANDVASVVAEALAGSEERFAEAMTRKARALGMKTTLFRNASGLPAKGQISSARDLAILARALIHDFPSYYRYFATADFRFHGIDYPNQNALLGSYSGADGIKTGYTRASGHNLAASATRGTRRVIAVVMGGPTLEWTRLHMVDLLDAAFETLSRRELTIAASKAARPPHASSATQAGRRGNPTAAAGGETATPNSKASPTAISDERRRRIPSRFGGIESGRASPATAGLSAGTELHGNSPAADAVTIESGEEGNPAAGAARNLAETQEQSRPTKDSNPPYEAKAIERIEIVALRKQAIVETGPPGGLQEQHSTPRPVAPPKREPPSGRWSLHIGLFNTLTVARMRGERAMSRLPSELGDAKLEIVSIDGASGPRVLARVAGFDEDGAREGCEELHRWNVPCIVVPPGRRIFISER